MELISGRLDISFTDSSNTTLQIGENLHNGDWHQLDVDISEFGLAVVQLRILGNNIGFLPMQQNVTLSPDHLIYGPVTFGSVSDLSPSLPDSFSGCMRMLYINEIAINLDINATSNPQFATPGCPREENCYPDPCANDGDCMSVWNGFSCSCLADFIGTNCNECELLYDCGTNYILYLLIFYLCSCCSIF